MSSCVSLVDVSRLSLHVSIMLKQLMVFLLRTKAMNANDGLKVNERIKRKW